MQVGGWVGVGVWGVGGVGGACECACGGTLAGRRIDGPPRTTQTHMHTHICTPTRTHTHTWTGRQAHAHTYTRAQSDRDRHTHRKKEMKRRVLAVVRPPPHARVLALVWASRSLQYKLLPCYSIATAAPGYWWWFGLPVHYNGSLPVQCIGVNGEATAGIPRLPQIHKLCTKCPPGLWPGL